MDDGLTGSQVGGLHNIDNEKTPVANGIFIRYRWYSMETRCVETFLVAVDHGSIAEAARRLDITPAAAAKRIRALGTEVGAVLVRRSGRTIKPTEAGAALIEPAKRFLSEARDFKSIARWIGQRVNCILAPFSPR